MCLDQIKLCPLWGAAFYLNYLVRLDVFKTYQVEITASANLLSTCFALNGRPAASASSVVAANISPDVA